ncbi:Uncharacterised protein [Amycolatopsis camponoti]|uniref:Uncharacterized protein n=1 Tax=Amycolatopsis camponoti TaxID=2606593 RepID=A0A6I8M265_9PSEU|nr:hypothetical protein [Amycolatopsis camponoti]VVJ22766.1 Uncharacterised protein [Amycolatopsis camponoti]
MNPTEVACDASPGRLIHASLRFCQPCTAFLLDRGLVGGVQQRANPCQRACCVSSSNNQLVRHDRLADPGQGHLALAVVAEARRF